MQKDFSVRISMTPTESGEEITIDVWDGKERHTKRTMLTGRELANKAWAAQHITNACEGILHSVVDQASPVQVLNRILRNYD